MSLANGRDLALMYFILIALGVTLMPGVLLFLAVRGLRLLRRRMLPYVHLAQFYSRRIAWATDQGSRKIAGPFVAAAGVAAQVQYLGGRLMKIFKH